MCVHVRACVYFKKILIIFQNGINYVLKQTLVVLQCDYVVAAVEKGCQMHNARLHRKAVVSFEHQTEW